MMRNQTPPLPPNTRLAKAGDTVSGPFFFYPKPPNRFLDGWRVMDAPAVPFTVSGKEAYLYAIVEEEGAVA